MIGFVIQHHKVARLNDNGKGKDWYLYDEDSDGGLTITNPDDIDYADKENLKAFLSQEN
jgi:hypothetical protein